MHFISFIVVKKATGVPVYIHNFEENSNYDSDSIIFSGIMSAIRNLMKDMDIGNIKSIQTEKYKIIGEEGENFMIFLIGGIENEELVLDFLSYLITFLDFVPLLDDYTNDLPEDINEYLDQMTDYLYNLFMRTNFIVGLYELSETMGLIKILSKLEEKVTNNLINYMASIPVKMKYQSHSFYEVLPDSSSIIGMTIPNKNKSITILLLYFEDMSIERYISYKHHYITRGIEFIGQNYEQLSNKSESTMDKELLVNNYVQLLQKSFDEYIPKTNIVEEADVLMHIERFIPDIVASLLLGKPLAIISDKENATKIIDLISHITGILDVTIELDPDSPKRITWCPPEFQHLFSSMRYVILDLFEGKLIQFESNKYIRSLWEKIVQMRKDDNLAKIVDLKNSVFMIWAKLNDIIDRVSMGANYSKIINEFDSEEKKIYQSLLSSISPKFGNKKLIIQGVINW